MEPQLTATNLDKVLAFLPLFEGPAESLYTEDTEHLTFTPFDYSPELVRFIETLYEQNFIIVFDWPSWHDEASRYMDDPDLVAQADLQILRKLLTAHVRADRFTDGHLAEMIDLGHLLAILKRLQAIRDGL
jgi:O-acetyl-ADP-ribose deacetylase